MNQIATRPSYYVLPYRLPAELGNPKPVPGRFSVMEYREGKTTEVFNISRTCPDLFNEILKRGIPEADARTVFYEITK